MELFERLEQELGFAYIIRFKGNILVGYPEMEQVAASNWLTPTGRTRTLKEVELTKQRHHVERVYCCHKSGMKDPGFGQQPDRLERGKALQLYGQRWGSRPVSVTSRMTDLAWEWEKSTFAIRLDEIDYFCSVRWP